MSRNDEDKKTKLPILKLDDSEGLTSSESRASSSSSIESNEGDASEQQPSTKKARVEAQTKVPAIISGIDEPINSLEQKVQIPSKKSAFTKYLNKDSTKDNTNDKHPGGIGR